MAEIDFPVTWLTQETYDRLRAELAHLLENRPTMATEINDRREEGDLKENGGYHAAKEEQGKQEARIRQLEALLRDARVGEAPASDGSIAPGMIVTVRFPGDDDTDRFLLASREDSGHTDLHVYSPQSPLGAAVNGAKPGESVAYRLPNGRHMKVEIVEMEPYVG